MVLPRRSKCPLIRWQDIMDILAIGLLSSHSRWVPMDPRRVVPDTIKCSREEINRACHHLPPQEEVLIIGDPCLP
jgi:hypothetical protein